MIAHRAEVAPLLALLLACLLATAPAGAQQTIPPRDRRVEVRTLDTPWRFDPPRDAGAWRARARSLREQVPVAAGLWPLPERGPLRAQVFGRADKATDADVVAWLTSGK